jgi:hypothetical protein
MKRRWTLGRVLLDALGLVGIVAAWASERVPALAIGGLVVVYLVVALVAGPLGRLFGLPPYRPDEAYSATLDHWRSDRKPVNTPSRGAAPNPR